MSTPASTLPPIPSTVVVSGPKGLRACKTDRDCTLSVAKSCCGTCTDFPFVALNAKVVEQQGRESTKNCPLEDWDCSKVSCPPLPAGCSAVPACVGGLCEARAQGTCERR